MKIFSFLFLILLILEQFNCAPSVWYSDEDYMRNVDPVIDCGFGPNSWNTLSWARLRYLSQATPRPTNLSDRETMTNEDQLSKEKEDKPSNKISEKSIDIATKPLMKPLIGNSSKTSLDEPSRKSLYTPSTIPESSSETLSDSATVSPSDGMRAENLFDDE